MLSQRSLLRAQRVIARTAVRRPYSTPTGTSTGFHGAQDNAFNRERAAVKAHAAHTTGLWRKLSIYAVIPAVLIAGANAYKLWNEHWEHWEHEAHEHPREERPEYQFQNIRSKNYFWGDGDKTLFWNDNVNYHKPSE